MQTVLSKITDGLELVAPQDIGDLFRLAEIMDVLAEIRLSRDMYGVDEQSETAAPQGEGTQGGARSSGSSAAPFGPS